MDRTQKWMGSVGCLGQIENIKRQSLIIHLNTAKIQILPPPGNMAKEAIFALFAIFFRNFKQIKENLSKGHAKSSQVY